MAGDWIKMRSNLWDDPRVSKLCDLTNQSEAAIVGALYWLWASADQHTEDGIMYGLTVRQIDRKTGVSGFGDALITVGWIADHPEGVRIVNFTDHNGTSAKKRCVTAKRVANYRIGNADVTQEALQKDDTSVSTALAREREREEKDISTTDVVDKKPRASRFDAQAHLVSIGVDPVIASDWVKHRHTLKASPSLTAINGIETEAARAGISLADALAICCQRGWRGFKAEWVQQGQAQLSGYKTKSEKDKEWLDGLLGKPRQEQVADSLPFIEGEVRRVA